jgi:hypothetical protein
MADANDPRELALLHDLQAALRAMTRAGGYRWDVKHESVVLDVCNIFDVDEIRLPFFIVEPTDDGERRFEPAMQLEDEFIATITARVDAIGDGVDRRNTLGLRFAADIEKALTVDIERGGFAVDTRLRKPQIYSSAGGEQTVLVVQRVVMKLFRTYGDPR